MLGIKRITGAADPAPEGEPGSWVSEAAREKFMAAYERAFALWPQPCEEFDIDTATATTQRPPPHTCTPTGRIPAGSRSCCSPRLTPRACTRTRRSARTA